MLKKHRITQGLEGDLAYVKNVFETTGFYFASYLRCHGYRLVGIRKVGRRSVFRFEDRADRQDAMQTYFNNEGTVQPLAYSAAIKNLKALIPNY